MQVDIVIALGIAAVVLVAIIQIARAVRHAAIHRTLRSAIEKGQPLDPALVAEFDRAPAPGTADHRIGLVLVAIAISIFVAAILNPGDDGWRELITIGVFPLLVGLALLFRPFISGKLRGE